MNSMMTKKRVLKNFALQSASTQSAGPPTISEIHAFSMKGTGGDPSYSVLQVNTHTGITGYGECRPLSPADVAALNQLAGKSAYAYEALTPLAPEPARGGFNMALLDILGKKTNAPAYRVLGGPTRVRARAIARLQGASQSELQSSLQQQLSTGVRAFLVPISSPTARNQGSEFVKVNLDRFTTLRAAAPDADFAIESGDQLTPEDAAMLAVALQPHHPLWFDEPCDINNLQTLRKISDQTVVPLGFGRTIRNASIFQDLLREGVIDLVRPDLLEFGISGACRIASMAEPYYTAVAPWHAAGPIATAAALHAAASMPNFFVLQVPNSGPGSAVIRNGFFELPKGPGLGVTVDTSNMERNRIA